MDQIIWLLDGTQSDSATDVLQIDDTEEECSFLKIENVVSLAPKSDNIGNENPVVSENIYRKIFSSSKYSIYY